MADSSISLQKIGLFTFLLIYILVISFITAMFSSSAVSTTVDMSNVRDPGNMGNPLTATPTFLGVLFGMITAMFQIMTFQVTFVPWFIQMCLAIPCYVFIIVLIDVIIDIANALSNFLASVLPW